jgi:hypothetical protein
MDFPPLVVVYHKQTKSPIHAEPKHLIVVKQFLRLVLEQGGSTPLLLLLIMMVKRILLQ